MDFDDVKKLATLPTDTLPLCLAGELVEDLAALEASLAEVKPATSLADTSAKRATLDRIAEVRERMRESTVDFKLRALPARKWSKFWATMPVRADNDSREEWDERVFPFYADMVSRCCVEPVMGVGQVEELADLLHHSAWSKLVNRCLQINMAEIDLPNFDAASDPTPNSGQT